MRKLIFRGMFVCLVALAATTALAANIDGTWVMKLETQKGTVEFHFKLKAEGDKLTGSVQRAGARRERPISDGKISGDEFSFTITRRTKKGESKTTYSGKVVGDELQGEFRQERRRRGRPFTAKRM